MMTFALDRRVQMRIGRTTVTARVWARAALLAVGPDAALGYVVIRFTWRQLTERPLLVAARLAQVLAVRAAAVPG